MKKIERKDILFIAGLILTTVLVCTVSITANAFGKPAQIHAQGDFGFDADDSGIIGDNPEDVYIAAEDFYYLYELCK